MKQNEFSKCNFCREYYDEFDTCKWRCLNHKNFEPNNDKIIQKAKVKGMSVTDVVTLINLNS